MLNRIFDPENTLFRILARMVDFVGLSILWALLCLPVVTIGPASAALYYTVVKIFREKYEETGAFSLMLKTFVSNLKRGIPITLICLGVGVLLFLGYSVMRANWGSTMGAVMFVAYDIALLLPGAVLCFIFPMMSRYDSGVKELFKNSAILVIKHLPSAIVVALLILQLAIFTIEVWVPLLFAPSLGALLSSLFIERIFKKYN